jgi:hypothetical protein
MPLELSPPQSDPVARAIEAILAEKAPAVDPWWAAGIAAALGLGGDGGPAPEDPRSGARVVEP